MDPSREPKDPYVIDEIAWWLTRVVNRTALRLCVEQMTGSEWDHVALVVPGDSTTSLELLEATGEGVVVSPMVGMHPIKKRPQGCC